MSETRTVFIPAISLDYENNLLESVSVGGETFFRKQRDWRAIAKSREQTIERMGAENAKLREMVREMSNCITYNHDCVDCTVNGESCDASVLCGDRMRELGIEVDE